MTEPQMENLKQAVEVFEKATKRAYEANSLLNEASQKLKILSNSSSGADFLKDALAILGREYLKSEQEK